MSFPDVHKDISKIKGMVKTSALSTEESHHHRHPKREKEGPLPKPGKRATATGSDRQMRLCS